MGYLGWKNQQTHAAWQEILRRQDEVVSIVHQVLEAGARNPRKLLEKTLKDWSYGQIPLQGDDGYFWGLLLALSWGEIDFDQIGLHILSEEARYSHDPYDPGIVKQDWSPRKPRWSDKDWTRRRS